MNLVELDTFVRVVDAGSLTAAAAQLGVPKSTVSRRVARLEDQLGLPLLNRGPRSVTVTEDGARLHARCVAALRTLAEVERELEDRQETPSGVLRLTAPQDLGHAGGFATLLTSFRARYPQVVVELDLTNRVVDLAGEGFDLALRPDAPRAGSSGLAGRRIARMGAGLYASPSYLEGRGRPTAPPALASHDLVQHRVLPRDRVVLRDDEGVEREAPLRTVMVLNDFALITAAAAAGAGIAVAPDLMARPYVERGELEPVLPSLHAMRGELWLIWPEVRQLAPRVRAFVDHLVAHAGDEALWR